MNPQKINLTTKDNQVLKANYYDTHKNKTLLLIHQYTKNKESWNTLIETLKETHTILAIDLRGHGESTGNYQDYTDEDFKKMRQDIETSTKYLKEKNPDATINIIGASIGANLAQNYAAENKHHKIVLLSPGLNYKGIELTIKKTNSLTIVSKEDTYSYESVKKIQEKIPEQEYIYLENHGHGTNMLSEEIITSINIYLNE